MKAIKTGGALLIGLSLLAGTAYASDAHYGLPAKATAQAAKAGSQASGYVVLYNYTYGSYTVYATFENSGKQLPPMTLGLPGSGTDVISYNVISPQDYEVCLNIVGYQGSIFNNCVQPGNDVKIGRPGLLKSQKSDQAVQVTVTKS